MPPLKRLAAALPFLLSLLLISGLARAQLVTGNTIEVRKPLDRGPQFEAGRDELSINGVDCTSDEEIGVNLVMAEPELQFEVWGGNSSANCDDDNSRATGLTNGQCWQVWSSEPDSDEFPIRVQDILPHDGSGYRTGTATSCTQPSSGSVTLWFMLVSGESNETASTPTLVFSYDLTGPKAATLTEITSGEGELILDWERSTSNDILGYRIYCEEEDTDPVSAGTSGSTGTSAGSSGTAGSGTGGAGTSGGSGGTSAGSGGTAGAGGMSASSGTAGIENTSGNGGTGGTETGGTGGSEAMGGSAGANAQQQQTDLGGAGGSDGDTGGTAGTAGTSGSAAVSSGDCRAKNLKAGEIPPPKFRRGSASQIANNGSAKDLKNNISYACGVAAYDKEENLGPLSNLKCGAPKYVTDYFEKYRDAGGQAGGGYCRFSRASAGSLGVIFGLAGLAFALRRRSRRSAQ